MVNHSASAFSAVVPAKTRRGGWSASTGKDVVDENRVFGMSVDYTSPYQPGTGMEGGGVRTRPRRRFLNFNRFEETLPHSSFSSQRRGL